MIEIPVINKEGKEIGKETISEELLGGHIRKALLKEAVLMYEANQRVGLANTKTRGEVKGSSRKRWRQKGTGRARIGSGKVSHFRGGGVAHGPRPRDFSYKMPKKARRLALKSALLAKLQSGAVKLIDELKLDAPKTREVHQILQKASFNRSCLVVNSNYDNVLYLSTRNLPYASLMAEKDLNAREVLRHLHILMTKEAFQNMKERFEKELEKKDKKS
ncbi:MAG: 50S ribosomal protein L4 [Planctomycetota bacterium]|nr:MAG: 50S ribosomal protein L4 [Planctomycetota bacterium]